MGKSGMIREEIAATETDLQKIEAKIADKAADEKKITDQIIKLERLSLDRSERDPASLRQNQASLAEVRASLESRKILQRTLKDKLTRLTNEQREAEKAEKDQGRIADFHAAEAAFFEIVDRAEYHKRQYAEACEEMCVRFGGNTHPLIRAYGLQIEKLITLTRQDLDKYKNIGEGRFWVANENSRRQLLAEIEGKRHFERVTAPPGDRAQRPLTDLERAASAARAANLENRRVEAEQARFRAQQRRRHIGV